MATRVKLRDAEEAEKYLLEMVSLFAFQPKEENCVALGLLPFCLFRP